MAVIAGRGAAVQVKPVKKALNLPLLNLAEHAVLKAEQ